MWITIGLVVVGLCAMMFVPNQGLGIWLGIALIVSALRRHMTQEQRDDGDEMADEGLRRFMEEQDGVLRH